MARRFRDAREVFKYYFPEEFKREERERLGIPEQRDYETNQLVKELLEDFKSGLNG